MADQERKLEPLRRGLRRLGDRLRAWAGSAHGQAGSHDRSRSERLFEQQAALTGLTKSHVFTGEDLEQFFRHLIETAARSLCVERVSLWRYTEDRAAIRCVDLYERSHCRHGSGQDLQAARYPAYFRALATSEAIVADDAHADPRTSEFSRDYLTPLGITAMMDIPLVLYGRLEGVVCHEQVGRRRPWMPEDRLFGIAHANLIALAIEQSERRRAEEALRESEARFRLLADAAPVMIWLSEPDGACTYFNRAWLGFTGRTPEEELVYRWAEGVHPEDQAQCLSAYEAALKARQRLTLEYRLKRHDGEYRWVLDTLAPRYLPSGEFAGFIGGCIDITERKAIDARIERLAYRDALTGLPNRALFMDRLEQALAQAARHGRQLALLFVDLDRFKTINDTLGHLVGDALLKQAGERLEGMLRAEDTVARLGGDEFVILLPGLSETHDAAHVASKAGAALSAPFAVAGHELHATASIGISVYPRDGADGATLLQHADVALYQAKERGRNAYLFFNPAMTREARERLSLENDLRRALERGELVLHYQLQAALADGAITGVEALVRWRHPERGLIRPTEFISIAEETGLIVPIGQWVLRSACAQAQVWQAAGFPRFRVGVNLSPRQFAREDLVESVREALTDTGLDPARLEIEITESSVAHDPGRAIDMLGQLRALGVQLALDDFGTGYSSLGYLKRFPLDRLKIDHSFVRDIPDDPDDVAIVQAILALARQLKLGVVAEGVETEAQKAFLKLHGCDEIQGYVLGRPVPAEALASLFESAVRA